MTEERKENKRPTGLWVLVVLTVNVNCPIG